MICAWHRSERTIHHARLSIRYHYNKKRVFCQRLFGIFPQIPRERPKNSLRHIVEKLHRGVTLFTNMWYNTANDGKAMGTAMRFVNYIWDFDGTLCDSYPHTTVQFLRAMGWGMERYDEVFRRLQVTWLDAIRYYRMSEAEDRAFRAAANSFAVDPYPTLFPGCRAVLTAIREGGVRSQGSASGARAWCRWSWRPWSAPREGPLRLMGGTDGRTGSCNRESRF